MILKLTIHNDQFTAVSERGDIRITETLSWPVRYAMSGAKECYFQARIMRDIVLLGKRRKGW